MMMMSYIKKADADDESMTPSRNDRRYTLRSVQSSPGRSFLFIVCLTFLFVVVCLTSKAGEDIQGSLMFNRMCD